MSVDASHCDEGGSHDFVERNRGASCWDWIACISCFPCYAACSCCLSDGAALANPVMEQMCHGDRDRRAGEGSDPICSRCGLTHAETLALARARADEKAGKRTTMPAGHFNQAALMDPEALPHDPRLSTRVGHTHYAPQQPMEPSPRMSQYAPSSPHMQPGGFGAQQPTGYPPHDLVYGPRS